MGIGSGRLLVVGICFRGWEWGGSLPLSKSLGKEGAKLVWFAFGGAYFVVWISSGRVHQ